MFEQGGKQLGRCIRNFSTFLELPHCSALCLTCTREDVAKSRGNSQFLKLMLAKHILCPKLTRGIALFMLCEFVNYVRFILYEGLWKVLKHSAIRI